MSMINEVQVADFPAALLLLSGTEVLVSQKRNLIDIVNCREVEWTVN